MALPNLSGSNIQDTFQRVLHTDGTEYFDGTGSVVPIVLANTSPSFASITASSDITASGTIHATRYIEAGANINTIYAPIASPSFTGAITASGNISASGILAGSNLRGTNTGDQDLSAYSTIAQLNASGSTLQTNINAKAPIASPSFTGDITASGNISASGNMTATSMSVDTIFGYNQHGEYTNNIRTGNLIAATNNTYHIGDYQNYYANIFSTQISTNGITTIGSGTEIEVAAGVLIPNVDKGPDLGTAAKRYGEVHSEQIIATHITASGNISASGNLFFNNIDGGTF